MSVKLNRHILGLMLLPILVAFSFLYGIDVHPIWAQDTESTETAPNEEQSVAGVERAIRETLRSRQEFVYNSLNTRIENIAISEDLLFASAWMILEDPATGQTIPTEPGLAILRWIDGTWQVALPGDPEWEFRLTQVSTDVVAPDEKVFWQDINEILAPAVPDAPISGYLLPWEGGKTAYLSGSVSHDAYIPSGNAHYAFDFYVPGSSSSVQFGLYAARAGTVWMYRDNQPDHDENSPGNYLILKDTSTIPITYQLYLHLAQNSIPATLKIIGTSVQQGEYIGVADDTGMSTGNHLHFHVHTEPASYWGRAVDITFDDVGINGGRPRVKNVFYNDETYCTLPNDVCNEYQSAYVSGNSKTDHNPPLGGFFGIEFDDLIQSEVFSISGWATDEESGIRSIQVLAAYENNIFPISPVFSGSAFSFNWNVCQSGVPDGPVTLGLSIIDGQSNQANLTGLVTVTKSYRCETPPATCNVNSNQVALFTEPNFYGQCHIFNTGTYSTLTASIGDNDAASIIVGQGVFATLFVKNGLVGRAETFLSNDSNLTDNRVGVDQVSSLLVGSIAQLPAIPNPVWPEENFIYDPYDSITFYWEDKGFSEEFQIRVVGASDSSTSNWIQDIYWGIGTQLASMSPGEYIWQVRSRNKNGTSGWSSGIRLELRQASNPAVSTLNPPLYNSFEGGTDNWSGSGLWHRDQDPSPINDPDGSYYWWFGESTNGNEFYFTEKQGGLTSPKINVPVSMPTYLKFNYAYQTESSGEHWDQRWVQVKVGDEPFTNLYQLKGETMTNANYHLWLSSPSIDLSQYAGEQIQIRFFFDTIDPSFSQADNDFEGWYIDDVEITNVPLPTCSDGFEPNDKPNQATFVEYISSTTLDAQICPGGDIDIYYFNGSANDFVAIDVDAQVLGSSLDSVLTLMDSDGESVLAVNDDLETGHLDSTIGYRLPRDGVYYLVVKPWDFPAGGSSYNYRISFAADANPPQVQILLDDNTVLGSEPTIVQAQITDQQSDIELVKFFWHDSNWNNPTWEFLGNGSRSGDLWEISFDSTGELEGSNGAFYVSGVDSGGHQMGDGAWQIVVDRTPPVSTMNLLDAVQTSTAINITWRGIDSLSYIDHFDLQVSIDSFAWQDLVTGISGQDNALWDVVEPGHLYAYRLRAVDAAGNVEAYPAVEETVTYVQSGSVLCSQPDGYEDDNSLLNARLFVINDSMQFHNLCNTSGIGGFQNDQDWLKIPVTAGEQFSISAVPDPGSTAFVELNLYAINGSGNTLLAQSSASTIGQIIWLSYSPASSGDLYLRVSSKDGRIFGVGTGYKLFVYSGPPRVIFIPVIHR